MYSCSPEWSKDWISPEDVEEVLKHLSGKIQGPRTGPRAVGLNSGLHFTAANLS